MSLCSLAMRAKVHKVICRGYIQQNNGAHQSDAIPAARCMAFCQTQEPLRCFVFLLYFVLFFCFFVLKKWWF